MSIVGEVESLWRYPVKSMRGEELAEAFVGFAGIYGDRLFAFRSSARPPSFPYLTGREREDMLLYRPRFRHPDKAARPPNLAAAEAAGLSPLSAAPAELAVEVEMPTGEVLDVDDPALLRKLGEGLHDGHVLTLLRSERAMTDCRPVSLFSLQTARQLGEETGMTSTSDASVRTSTWISVRRPASPRIASSTTACGSEPRQWSRSWSATSAAR